MKIEGIQARINQNGRIVVPAVIRKGMGLKLGDSVVMSLENGVLRIEPQRASHRTRPPRAQDEPRQIVKPPPPASNIPGPERRQESTTEREEPEAQTEDWLG